MRNTATFFVLILTGLLAQGQYWTPLAPYPVAVDGAYGFDINGRIFLGGGISSYAPLVGHTGFYEYLPDSDQWVARTTPPFGAVYRAAAFVEEQTASGWLIGGSRTDPYLPSNEVWKYDPFIDVWTQMASLPGQGREGAVVIPLNGVSFAAGLGGEPGLNDWYAYDILNDQWSARADLPGGGRTGATAGLTPYFYIPLVGMGAASLADSATTFFDDWYTYAYDQDTWIPYPMELPQSIPRAGVAMGSLDHWNVGLVDFFFGGHGVVNGERTVLGDCYASALLDGYYLGIRPGGPVTNAVALSSLEEECIYIGTGCTSFLPGTWKPATFSDAWLRYTPGGLSLGVDDQIPPTITWRSDGAHLHVQWPAGSGNVELDVLDALGRSVKAPIRTAGSSGQAEIDMSGLSAGTYLLRWRSDERTDVIHFVQP